MKFPVCVQTLMLLLFTQLSVAQIYESPEDMRASDVLPAERVAGVDYQVVERVVSDGYLNYYRIKSEYGDFDAVGINMLNKRIGEIGALRQLDELSKTEVFIKAAADAGLGQVRQISAFATRPVDTILGVPEGIGRMFKRYRRDANEAVAASQEFVADMADGDEASPESSEDDNEGTTEKMVGLTESVMGVSGAERAWAKKLGTDPYSSNEVLQEAIREVAWAEKLGSFGMSFAGVPKIPGADIIADVNDAVWSKDPYELKDLNRARLDGTGANAELVEAYLDTPLLTPTQKSVLTAALAEMDPIEGREGVLVQALNVRNPVEANFLVDSVIMLAWYHLNQKPLTAVKTYAAVPVGVAGDGTSALIFAADHVYWTESIAEAAAGHGREIDVEAGGEVWLLGTASERTRTELKDIGFMLQENVAELIAAADIE